jgi:hypothetical protein
MFPLLSSLSAAYYCLCALIVLLLSIVLLRLTALDGLAT